MGPNETEYKRFWPDMAESDAKIVKRYPNDREFIFEQLLKTKRNIGEYKLSQNPNFIPGLPLVTTTSPIFFVFMSVIVVVWLLILFILT